MSCEHNTTDCLICIQSKPICLHGLGDNCPQCDPIGSRQRKTTLMADRVATLENEITALKATLSMERQRANMLGDELGAMRSDRNSAYAQLKSMQKAFEIQSRQLAKVSKPGPGLPRR